MHELYFISKRQEDDFKEIQTKRNQHTMEHVQIKVQSKKSGLTIAFNLAASLA